MLFAQELDIRLCDDDIEICLLYLLRLIKVEVSVQSQDLCLYTA